MTVPPAPRAEYVRRMDHKKLSIGLALVVAFLAGCVVAQTFQVRVAPPARAGTTPQRWEYYCAYASNGLDGVQSVAAAAGLQGWEMVNFESSDVRVKAVCFKRPLS